MKPVPKETIQEIADLLSSGFSVFLNKESLELISYPNEDRSVSFEPSMWSIEIQTIKKEKDKYLEIHGMDSNDSFRIVEDFIAMVNEPSLKERLTSAIHQKKPFAHFKKQIDRSNPYRERWFRFRDQKMIEWVQEQINQIY